MKKTPKVLSRRAVRRRLGAPAEALAGHPGSAVGDAAPGDAFAASAGRSSGALVAGTFDEIPGLRGLASFYGHGFQGRRTASGERFDVRVLSAASNRFPLGSLLAVRRENGGPCVVVKVNDRMHVSHRRRVVDVSRAAAERLGMLRAGLVMVRVAPLPAAFDGEAGCAAAFAPEAPGVTASGDSPPLDDRQLGMRDSE